MLTVIITRDCSASTAGAGILFHDFPSAEAEMHMMSLSLKLMHWTRLNPSDALTCSGSSATSACPAAVATSSSSALLLLASCLRSPCSRAMPAS